MRGLRIVGANDASKTIEARAVGANPKQAISIRNDGGDGGGLREVCLKRADSILEFPESAIGSASPDNAITFLSEGKDVVTIQDGGRDFVGNFPGCGFRCLRFGKCASSTKWASPICV